jgi:hypothetical protein
MAPGREPPAVLLARRPCSQFGPTSKPRDVFVPPLIHTRIADGPVRVELNRSLETDIPGVKFGVAATAFSNEDDQQLDGASVDITLVLANTT